MLKLLARTWFLVVIAISFGLTIAPSADAVPMVYALDSGTATLTVVLDDGLSTNVLDATTHPLGTIDITLDGSQVTFDPTASLYGTLLSLELTDAGPIFIDLDQTSVALDTLSIVNAILSSAVGATADRTSGGSFTIDSMLNATASGVYPDLSTFGPAAVSSLTSGAGGTIGISGSQLMLGINGINIATFAQIANPDPLAPDILVKADFLFIGTLVPEPGTTVLLGLGLIGLSARRRGL